MVYAHSIGKMSFEVIESGKEYSVPQIALLNADKNINEYWDGLTPEEKEAFLVTKNPKELKKILGAADKLTNQIQDLTEALQKALPPEQKPKVQFASLQEMYDSAKPTKLKKEAAKSLGKTSPGLTFGGNQDLQYQPLKLEIKDTTSSQDFKIYNTKTQPVSITGTTNPININDLLNWLENPAEQDKKAK